MIRINPLYEALIFLIIALFVSVGLSVGYTAKTRSDDNRQLCQILIVLDKPVPTPGVSPAPLTQREREIATAVHTVRLAKCGGMK